MQDEKVDYQGKSHKKRNTIHQNFIAKFWDKNTPLPQLVGYVFMLMTIVGTASAVWTALNNTVSAHETRLAAHESRLTSIETWKQDKDTRDARIEQKLDDIHDALLQKH